jgi:hypothetical protein
VRNCLTLAELVDRTGASPRLVDEWIRDWLERGIVERVNGGYGLVAEYAGPLRALRGVPLGPGDDDGFPRLKPGPAKGTPRKVAA